MRISLFIRVCVSMLALYLLSPTVQAVESLPWVVDTVSGDVYVRQMDQDGKGDSKTVVPGTILWAPFEVITGRDGKARLQRGADRIEVSPNSVIELGADVIEATGLLSRVRLMLGVALFNVDKQPKRGFEVETPFLVSVVKGTTFNVRVGTRAAGVSLIEGRLLVLNDAREDGLIIEPGQTAYSDPSDKKIHMMETLKLDSSYEQLMSRANVKGQREDGGVADVSSWSLMASVNAPVGWSGNGTPVGTSRVVGGALRTVGSFTGTQETAGSLTGSVESTAQTLTNTLSDTVLGGTVAGLESTVGQLLESGSPAELLDAAPDLIGGIPPVVDQLPVQLPLPIPLPIPLF